MYREDKIVWGIVLTLLFLLLAAVSVPIYWGPKAKAEIINAQFGTHYTTWDMIVAGDTIEATLVGQKHRVDIEKQ